MSIIQATLNQFNQNHNFITFSTGILICHLLLEQQKINKEVNESK